MLFKSSSVTTFLLLATLAIVSTAQEAPTTTVASTTTAAATTPVATGTSSASGTSTVTTAPIAHPTSNFTAVPDFSSLASVIASVATARSLNPGFSPTPKPGGPGASAASRVGAGGEVLMGLGLVVLSAVVAGAGTLAL
ncbi:hypothetical protein BGZ96_008682 [Linnemannia gamsii]|uniref:Uncharacterized protein n=1 Tax=Linnemannia gamsii TaxID=64522 RepID=A0ABQ7JYN6_9FUNG|nr:hypothetical protein BGZ96_008682 [Linnemannia gamsii]